jgi:hypothetical protein
MCSVLSGFGVKQEREPRPWCGPLGRGVRLSRHGRDRYGLMAKS